MSMENLKKSLLQEAEKEASAITSKAEKEASAIISAAREEARKRKEEARARAKGLVAAEKTEKLSGAQLRAKKIVSEAKSKVVEENLGIVWREFSRFPEDKRYEGLLKKWIAEAEESLGGKTVVSVNEKDAKLAKKFSKNVSAKAVDIAGGAIIFSQDGKVSIDSSLESVFRHNEPEARKIVFNDLSGKVKG